MPRTSRLDPDINSNSYIQIRKTWNCLWYDSLNNKKLDLLPNAKVRLAKTLAAKKLVLSRTNLFCWRTEEKWTWSLASDAWKKEKTLYEKRAILYKQTKNLIFATGEHFKKLNLLTFSIFVGHFCPPGSRTRFHNTASVSDPYSFFTDPDPDPVDPDGGQYGSGYGSGAGSNPDPGL